MARPAVPVAMARPVAPVAPVVMARQVVPVVPALPVVGELPALPVPVGEVPSPLLGTHPAARATAQTLRTNERRGFMHGVCRPRCVSVAALAARRQRSRKPAERRPPDCPHASVPKTTRKRRNREDRAARAYSRMYVTSSIEKSSRRPLRSKTTVTFFTPRASSGRKTNPATTSVVTTPILCSSSRVIGRFSIHHNHALEQTSPPATPFS